MRQLLIDWKARYNKLSASAVRELGRTDPAFRADTERLFTAIARKTLNKNCGDCWVDAYAVLMTTDPDKAEEMTMERLFDLRAGAVLRDPMGDMTKLCTRLNLTDELALYHLAKHPDCITLFSKYPEDWHDRAVAFASPATRTATKPAAKAAEIPSAESAEPAPIVDAPKPKKPATVKKKGKK